MTVYIVKQRRGSDEAEDVCVLDSVWSNKYDAELEADRKNDYSGETTESEYGYYVSPYEVDAG